MKCAQIVYPVYSLLQSYGECRPLAALAAAVASAVAAVAATVAAVVAFKRKVTPRTLTQDR